MALQVIEAKASDRMSAVVKVRGDTIPEVRSNKAGQLALTEGAKLVGGRVGLDPMNMHTYAVAEGGEPVKQGEKVAGYQIDYRINGTG